jgi:hypothetical protein
VPQSQVVDELSRRLDLIQKLTAELAKVRDDAIEQQALAERINREIMAAKNALNPTI